MDRVIDALMLTAYLGEPVTLDKYAAQCQAILEDPAQMADFEKFANIYRMGWNDAILWQTGEAPVSDVVGI